MPGLAGRQTAGAGLPREQPLSERHDGRGVFAFFSEHQIVGELTALYLVERPHPSSLCEVSFDERGSAECNAISRDGALDRGSRNVELQPTITIDGFPTSRFLEPRTPCRKHAETGHRDIVNEGMMAKISGGLHRY